MQIGTGADTQYVAGALVIGALLALILFNRGFKGIAVHAGVQV